MAKILASSAILPDGKSKDLGAITAKDSWSSLLSDNNPSDNNPKPNRVVNSIIDVENRIKGVFEKFLVVN